MSFTRSNSPKDCNTNPRDSLYDTEILRAPEGYSGVELVQHTWKAGMMAGYFRSSRLNCYTTLKVPKHPRGIHQNIWAVHLGRCCCCLLVVENASTLFSSFHFTSFPFCRAQLSNFHLHHTHSQSLPVCISPWLYIARANVNTSTVSA